MPDKPIPKRIQFKTSPLVLGALKLAQVVRVTYGPQGRNVLLDRFAGLLSTKDGVTVAREIELPDPVENMGASILREACLEVNNSVGDGTTAAALIAASLIQQGHKLKAAGVDLTTLLKDELPRACEHAVNLVKRASQEVAIQSDLERVAYVASNGDRDMAEKIAEGCLSVGVGGSLVVEEGQSTALELLMREGMEIDRGWDWDVEVASRDKEKSDGMKEKIEGPVVAVLGAPLESRDDILMMMEEASQFKRQVVIIAERVDGFAMSMMVYNSRYTANFWKWIQAPGHTHKERLENLKDIAALSGAHYIDPLIDDHRRHFKTEWLGSLRKVTLWPHKAVLEGYDDKIESIKQRVNVLKNDLEHTTSDYDRDQLERRIARLVGGLGTLRVGGFTEPEIKEKVSRVEDALRASQAALKGGFVPGGGIIYHSVGDSLQRFRGPAWEMLSNALKEPPRQLLRNAGLEPDIILSRLKAWEGWDLDQNRVSKLEGVVDATPVVTAAIQTACSVAGLLLGAEATVTRSERNETRDATS